MRRTLILLLLAGIILSGCGVKPKAPEPPSGKKAAGAFPRVYPDVSTDQE